MKRILITGANSYIGISFENYIKSWEDEYQVETLGTVGLVPNAEMFNGYDVVFHVAGIAHIKETRENRDLYYKINRDLAVSVANNAKKAGVKQFIILSSMSVYGLVEGHITKTTIPKPTNAYGDSKLQADKYIEKISDDCFKVAILRPPMVYGKGCKGNYQKLRGFALRAPFFPKINNKRSMIYIYNLCHFVKEIIDDEKNGLFFPQNLTYVNTCSMVEKIAECNQKSIFLTELFNPIVKLINWNIFKKVFGDLTYEACDTVNEYSFEDSIKYSEIP